MTLNKKHFFTSRPDEAVPARTNPDEAGQPRLGSEGGEPKENRSFNTKRTKETKVRKLGEDAAGSQQEREVLFHRFRRFHRLGTRNRNFNTKETKVTKLGEDAACRLNKFRKIFSPRD
jgi:hypothetical protein